MSDDKCPYCNSTLKSITYTIDQKVERCANCDKVLEVVKGVQ